MNTAVCAARTEEMYGHSWISGESKREMMWRITWTMRWQEFTKF